MTTFKKAVRSQRKLRMALYGASGSGKSYTALVIAKGLGDKIAVIDTEHASASLYADTVASFDTCELTHYAPRDYVKAMEAAKDYDVLVIDSLSHAWMGEGGLLEQADKKGGNFGVWKDLTPQQTEMFEAMLSFPGHIIVTMRSKTEYQVTEYERDGKKKTRVERIGMAPIQRKESEYEFDVVGQMDQDNVMHIVKSRFDGLDLDVRKPDAKFAARLKALLMTGAEAPPPRPKKEIDVTNQDRLQEQIQRALGAIEAVKTKEEMDSISARLAKADKAIQSAVMQAYTEKLQQVNGGGQ